MTLRDRVAAVVAISKFRKTMKGAAKALGISEQTLDDRLEAVKLGADDLQKLSDYLGVEIAVTRRYRPGSDPEMDTKVILKSGDVI